MLVILGEHKAKIVDEFATRWFLPSRIKSSKDRELGNMSLKDGLRVLLFQEQGYWFAQALEFDISARGKSVAEAQENFSLTAVIDLKISLEKTGEEFGGIDPAPDRFHKMFEGASGHPTPVKMPPGTFDDNRVLEQRLVA